MVFETEKIESLLVECIESRNEHQFQYILDDLKINPNTKLKCFNGLSTFEKVLTLPNSRKFIEICIYNGSDFYKKNADGVFPLHYAIDSLCADNLQTILKPVEESFTPLCDDHLITTQYSRIVNEKLDGGNNYLHLLINNVTNDNYEEVTKMIKALLVNSCNINSPNDQQETPFYLLLKNPFVQTNFINLVIENTRIDFYSYHSNEVIRMMEDRGLQSRLSEKKDFIVDLNCMTQHLGEWNELKFIKNLEVLKTNSQDFHNDIVSLLEDAIAKNVPETVSTLMTYGANINEIPKNGKFKMTPLFLACTFGHHQVLKKLLNDQNLSFESNKFRRNLLHQIFSSEWVDADDRQKSFDLIIADTRCTLDVINQVDSENNSPLFFACKYGCDEMTMELLRRGAYIGHESVLNYIKKDILGEFLDECLKTSSDINDKNCEIYMDYKFLIPPNASKLEITTAHLISSNSNLKEFISHPVIASFVLLKWRKIDFIVYFNMLVYFGFMLFLGFIIINFYNVPNDVRHDSQYCDISTQQHDDHFNIKLSEYTFLTSSSNFDNNSNPVTQMLFNNLDVILRFYNNSAFDYSAQFMNWETFRKEEEWKTRFRQNFADHSLSYWFGIFGLVLMALYEIIQFMMSWKKYFFKPINWLDISLIGFSFFVLIKNVEVGRDSFKQICAIMILLMGAQSIQLVSKVSAFSLSLHMAILTKVCKTFLKTIAPYLIVISAFGMSFYALNFDDYFEKVNGNVDDHQTASPNEDLGFSNPFLSTISTVRMMLSDFGAVNIRKNDHFQGIIFLAFMVSISIVLFNLLNALAISDTNEMMEVAEFVEIKMRISTLRSYETLFSFFKITYSNVFPQLTTIMLTPNVHNAIKVKRSIQISDNVMILMQKTGKISKFEYLVTDWMFWKGQPEPISFDEKFMKKILDFVKNQQENDLTEADKYLNKQELHALKMVQEDICKDLQELKISQEILQTSIDENLKNQSKCLNILNTMLHQTMFTERR